MTAIVAAVKPVLKVPFGVNYLWDPYATVALAVATGASFAREVFTGVYASDMGLWQPDCAGALAAAPRSRPGRLEAPVQRQRGIRRIRSTNARSSCAPRAPSSRRWPTSICVSGPITGQPVDSSDLEKVKAAVPRRPVFANTGVNIDNVADILAVADGCVIGTHFKVDGDTWNPVDGARVEALHGAVRELR